MNANPKSGSGRAFIVPAGETRPGGVLNLPGQQTLVKISSRDTNGAFAVAETVVPPLGGPPLHIHHMQDEWWRILEGEFLFEVDGEEIYAGPGDTVFSSKGTVHTFQNIGRTAARAMVTVVPGGIDLFFEEVCKVAETGTPDEALLQPLFEKYGLELLGPPISMRK